MAIDILTLALAKKMGGSSGGTKVQSDWNQKNKNAADFIKNKPEFATNDEIIELLEQEDMLPVVTDFDGSILTDESSNILLW